MSLRLVRLVALSPHPLLRSSPRAREVLALLADRVGQSASMRCWPSLADLMRTGLSHGTVCDALRQLQAEGLVIDTGNRTGKSGRIVVRQLVADVIWPNRPGGSDSPGESDHPSHQDADRPGHQDADRPGHQDADRPGHQDAEPLKEPSMEPSMEPSTKPVRETGPQGVVVVDPETASAAAELVDRYLEEDRPADRTLTRSARARIEADIIARLREGIAAAAVWRAWELLRAERGWRQPQRLGWLVAVADRIHERFARAGEELPEDIEHTGEVQELQLEPPDNLLESSLPPWGDWIKHVKLEDGEAQ